MTHSALNAVACCVRALHNAISPARAPIVHGAFCDRSFSGIAPETGLLCKLTSAADCTVAMPAFGRLWAPAWCSRSRVVHIHGLRARYLVADQFAYIRCILSARTRIACNSIHFLTVRIHGACNACIRGRVHATRAVGHVRAGNALKCNFAVCLPCVELVFATGACFTFFRVLL